MEKILVLICLIVFQFSYAQSSNRIENIIRSYPEINSTEKLYERIKHDFKTDIDRVKAVYTWITLNIKYKYATSFELNEPEEIVYFNEEDLARKLKIKNDALVEKTIQNKEGVCKNIALTLKKICDLFAIENELIKGYIKDTPEKIGIIPQYKNHVWNAVKVDRKWLLVDATYGIDYDRKFYKQKTNYTFFDIAPEKLKLTHYPSKREWVNYLGQVSVKSFGNLPMMWNDFLSKDVELVSPKYGILPSSRDKIFITLKGLNEKTKITYSFEGDSYARIPKIIRNKPYTNIVINSEKEGLLTLYFDKISALAFHVK